MKNLKKACATMALAAVIGGFGFHTAFAATPDTAKMDELADFPPNPIVYENVGTTTNGDTTFLDVANIKNVTTDGKLVEAVIRDESPNHATQTANIIANLEDGKVMLEAVYDHGTKQVSNVFKTFDVDYSNQLGMAVAELRNRHFKESNNLSKVHDVQIDTSRTMTKGHYTED